MTQNKYITVFGGTGFIGRYLIDRLCDQGYTVRVATRRPQGMYFLRTAGFVGQVVAEHCDIFNEQMIRDAILGSDAVVNLIGVLNEKGRQNFDNVHHLFPERLAKIAAEANVPVLVHVSSLSAGIDSTSHYSQSKLAGEKAILAHFPKATILRPSLVFGPEDNFFNRFAHMAEISPFLPLVGGGKTTFQPVYVGDVVKAILRALKGDNAVTGEIFELGGEDQLTFKELLQKIIKLTGHKAKMLPLPFPVAKIQGAILQMLPGQLLTIDQVRSLQTDNVLTGGKPGLRDLGIDPTPLEAILPTYLKRFRAGGRFAGRRVA